MTPDEIYAESFRIIEAEAGGHTFDAMEWPVVRRMVHASSTTRTCGSRRRREA
jgi:precorrin-8X/cobalt-precorrin-8 methylmutase